MNRLIAILFCLVCYGPNLSSQQVSSALHVDFEDCTAFLSGSYIDYSEFTAQMVSSIECDKMLLAQPNHLFRASFHDNAHSCTEGINPETLGMCITASELCAYTELQLEALKFNVQLHPGAYGLGHLDSLTFYQKAPETYQFHEGLSGPNNYPVFFALRILKNNQEIFRQDNIPTSREWNKVSFDFSSVQGFKIHSSSQFQFELLPYCPIGNSASSKVFDIDELFIHSVCDPISAGTIYTTDSLEICTSSQDRYRSFYFQNVYGTNSTWVVTDTDNNVIRLSASQTIDFLTHSVRPP